MKKIVLLILILVSVTINSQEYKFGKVSKAELEEQVYPLDSSANAAFLYKNRNTYFDYHQEKGFQLITEVHERIKIYNNKGYEWATKKIEYYTPSSGKTEKVSNLDAKTFVLEGGKVNEYKLKKKQIFEEKKNKFYSVKKFTMPNVSDGCIVEFKYKIISPYFTINKVELQYSIPIKKVECSIDVPEYYNFSIKSTGYVSFKIDEIKKNGEINLSIKQRDGEGVPSFSPISTSYSNEKIRYIRNITNILNENVPALIEEEFVDNIDNYKSAVYFELSSVKWPGKPIKYYSHTWEDVSKTLLKDERFGSELNKTNYFKQDLALILSKYKNPEDRIIPIFEFVKKRIKWNNYNGVVVDEGVKNAYKKGTGNVADINLVLTAMLRESKLDAYPIVLSTRSNGVPIYPTINGLNYVVTAVKINENIILLDATEEYSKPNVLPQRAINWQGVLLGENGKYQLLNLSNTNKATLSSSVKVKFNEDGDIEGLSRTQYNNYFGMMYRKEYIDLNEDDFISKIESVNGDIEIENIRLTNKKNAYLPLVELFKFKSEGITSKTNNKIYIKPLLFNSILENNFRLDDREYPINFTVKSIKKYLTSIQLPEGYAVESIPESLAIGLPEELGSYKFRVIDKGDRIEIFSEMATNSVIYPAQYYQELKEFYKNIVKKNAEQIVLKKI